MIKIKNDKIEIALTMEVYRLRKYLDDNNIDYVDSEQENDIFLSILERNTNVTKALKEYAEHIKK